MRTFRDFIHRGIAAQKAVDNILKGGPMVHPAANDDDQIIPALADRMCPDCTGRTWRHGPHGGLSRNIECRGCKARFNVTWFKDNLIHADRLDSEANGGSVWREEWFPK